MPESLFDKCVSRLEESPVSSIVDHTGKTAGYGDTDAAIRYHNPAPVYISTWLVNANDEKQRSYSPPHTHPFPEINIPVAPPGELAYEIRLGDEKREVESPASIVIPPDVPHSANILSGLGSFVVLRIQPEQIAALYQLGQRFKQERHE